MGTRRMRNVVRASTGPPSMSPLSLWPRGRSKNARAACGHAKASSTVTSGVENAQDNLGGVRPRRIRVFLCQYRGAQPRTRHARDGLRPHDPDKVSFEVRLEIETAFPFGRRQLWRHRDPYATSGPGWRVAPVSSSELSTNIVELLHQTRNFRVAHQDFPDVRLAREFLAILQGHEIVSAEKIRYPVRIGCFLAGGRSRPGISRTSS